MLALLRFIYLALPFGNNLEILILMMKMELSDWIATLEWILKVMAVIGASLGFILFILNRKVKSQKKVKDTEKILKSISEYRDEQKLITDLALLENHFKQESSVEKIETLDSFIKSDFEKLLIKTGFGNREFEKQIEVFSIIYASRDNKSFFNYIMNVIQEKTNLDDEASLGLIDYSFEHYFPRKKYPELISEILKALELAEHNKIELLSTFLANHLSLNQKSHVQLVNNEIFISKLLELKLISRLIERYKNNSLPNYFGKETESKLLNILKEE